MLGHTGKRDAPSGEPSPESSGADGPVKLTDGDEVNAFKLARIHAMSEKLIDELHQGGLDDQSLARLEQVTGQTLVEMGSAVPDNLLEELAHLFGPSMGQPSEAELRVVWAAMLGWLHGLVLGEQLSQEVPTPLPPSPDEGPSLPPPRMSPYL